MVCIPNVLPWTITLLACLYHHSAVARRVGQRCCAFCPSSLVVSRRYWSGPHTNSNARVGSLLPSDTMMVVMKERIQRGAASFFRSRGARDDDDSSSHGDEEYVVAEGVTLKMAFDESWAVADEETSGRFTCRESLDLVHRLRRCSDCVLVGRATVERDNCTLTVRRVAPRRDRDGRRKQPVRVIIDPTLRLLRSGQRYAIFHDGLFTLLYHAAGLSTTFWKNDTTGPITLLDTASLDDDDQNTIGALSPQSILDDLQHRWNMSHVMIEGGPATARLFLKANAVDRAILIRAPVTFSNPVPSHMSESMLRDAGLEKLGSEPCGDDTIDVWSRPRLPWPRYDDGGTTDANRRSRNWP